MDARSRAPIGQMAGLGDPRTVVRLAGLPSNPARALACALRTALRLRTTPLLLRGGDGGAEGLCFLPSGAARAAALAAGHADILGVRVWISPVGGGGAGSEGDAAAAVAPPPERGATIAGMGSRVCAGPDCARRDREWAGVEGRGDGARRSIEGARYRKICFGFFDDECGRRGGTFGTRPRRLCCAAGWRWAVRDVGVRTRAQCCARRASPSTMTRTRDTTSLAWRRERAAAVTMRARAVASAAAEAAVAVNAGASFERVSNSHQWRVEGGACSLHACLPTSCIPTTFRTCHNCGPCLPRGWCMQ
jgi:hypothetical protein